MEDLRHQSPHAIAADLVDRIKSAIDRDHPHVSLGLRSRILARIVRVMGTGFGKRCMEGPRWRDTTILDLYGSFFNITRKRGQSGC
jgi:hypothetical protein